MLHHLQNFLQGRILGGVSYPELDAAVRADTAADGRFADLYAARNRFPGQRGGVEIGLAFDDNAVERDPLTDADDDGLADKNVVGLNLNFAAVTENRGVVRTEVHQLLDRPARTLLSVFLKQLADAVQNHDGDRLGVLAHGKCTEGRNGHQKIFREQMSAHQILRGADAFIAVTYLMNYAPEHNLYPQNPGLLLHGTDTVMVHDRVSFSQIKECIGVPMEDLVFFNPQYTKRVIPGTRSYPYSLRMPTKYTLMFTQLEDSIYSYVSKAEKTREVIEEKEEEVSNSFVHVVKKGESLGSIARKYHVTVANIKAWNRLKRETIHVGQRLTIYRSSSPMAQVSKASKGSTSKSSGNKKVTNTPKVRIHTVKKGETLSSISRKYGCTVSELKKWNGLKGNTVKVGQKLKIKK